MYNLLDYNPEKANIENVDYGTFWGRVAASLIDALVLIFIAPLSIYNVIDWKSIPLFIALTLIGIAYKPFMEYQYQATLGKMAMRLVVTNYDFQTPNLQEIILRNIFHIATSITSFFITLALFNDIDFAEITTYANYQFAITKKSSIYTNIEGLVFIISVIFMFFDDQNRTLHDKIGKTLVVKKDSLYSR